MPRRWEHYTNDDALPLDVRGLQRRVDLHGFSFLSVQWNCGANRSSVSVSVHNGDGVTISFTDVTGNRHTESINITWTRPNFGGERPWWECPCCYRRCAVLYALGENPFLCRLCLSLTYVTAQSDTFSRAMRKDAEFRRRLGWNLGEPFPHKPKGMHWRTWDRLVSEYSTVSARTNVELGKWVDQMSEC